LPWLIVNADVTISDDVERLRFARNKIVHRIKPDIDLIEMSDYFSSIVNITQRINTYLGQPPDQGFAREVLNFQTHCNKTDNDDITEILLKVALIRHHQINKNKHTACPFSFAHCMSVLRFRAFFFPP
jgi:hypothetical protein